MATITKHISQMADKDGNPLIGPAQAHLADLSVAYADDASANDLDTDAKRVAAMNATNTRINQILLILEAHGLMKVLIPSLRSMRPDG